MDIGLIMAWHGTVATIPEGFALCDGTQGTPDLRDRFIVGARQDDAGQAKTNITGALTVSGGTKSHTHGIPGGNEILAGTDFDDAVDSAVHIPPYYALAFIMRIVE